MATLYPLTRRRFLATAGAAATGLVAGPVLASPDGAQAAPYSGAGTPLPANLFTLGVGSGDPLPHGVVLWTRLAPDPLNGGGMPDRPVPVRWQVATDPKFRQICARGTAFARPEWAHSVHVEVGGLEPDREYFYRLRAGDEVSPVGRTRTAPGLRSKRRSLRFAIASCQDYQAGFYTAHHHLAEEDLAFVAFLGDYIYELRANPAAVRQHEGTDEPYSLVEYRNRYARYRTDVNLQEAHAAFPWIVTFDDHELDNNWADDMPQDPALQSPEAFRARRISAFRAYYEHMPLRRASRPQGPDLRLYRRLRFGQLVSLHVLDTRQYRSDQPITLDEANDPVRTMTGLDQERWLLRGLARSRTRWNLLANQVMWASNDRRVGPEQVFDFDNWDGYRAQRRRLLEFFGHVRNPVVLTGDRHCTWVCDLKPEFDDPASPVVGAEITGTSMTNGGNADPVPFHQTYDPIMAESPHWRYIDNRRGYVVCDVTDEGLLAELRVVSSVWQPTDTTIRTAARFAVEAGRPGIASVDELLPPSPLVADGPRYPVDDDQG